MSIAEPKTARRIVLAVTCCVAGLEWLLFELFRTPYNPPFDMSTLLGTEKYFVASLMGTILLGWSLFYFYCLVTVEFTGADYTAFLWMFIALGAVLTWIVLRPPWPVTPYSRLWS